MSGPAQDLEDGRRAPSRRSSARWNRWLAGAVSVGCHALILVALVSARIDPPYAPAAPPMAVALVAPPPPPPPPPPEVMPPKTSAPVTASPAAAKAPTRSPTRSLPRSHLRPTPRPPPDVEPLPASEVPTPQPVFGLGEAELAGATTAGSGGSGSGGAGAGGGCNMVRLLQDALRKNPRVGAAIARAHPETVAAGKAIMVWNGDWIRDPGQDGKGLAGIRQAIAMEIAFAPEPCRADPVRGLVVISLDDRPGAVRLALGAGRWRWSDLVFAQSARPG